MTFLRRFARSAYNQVLSRMLAATIANVKILSPGKLRAQLGGAETLRIAAPGSSVRDSDRLLGPDTGPCHVLGVNYFSECTDLGLWKDCGLFVIEPHPTRRRYVASIRRVAAEKGACFVIVKGLGSPRKIRGSLAMVRELSQVSGVTVLLSKDLYITDLPQASYAAAVVDHPSAVVSGSKTFLWTLSFGYAAGYSTIILHGFDFGGDYAYAETARGTDEKLAANDWTARPELRDTVLEEVQHLTGLLQSRAVRLLQCACKGPLKQLLPPDPACGG